MPLGPAQLRCGLGLASAIGLGLLAAIWFPVFDLSAPGRAGLGADYAFFMPNLVAGAFWHLHNSWWSLPWFTPAQCGGEPLHADPQGMYLSLTQVLTFWLGPLPAVRLSLLAYAAAGGAGAWWLARDGFRLGRPAATLAAAVFLFNGFFGVRMAVGHLGFAPFMLSPAMAACAVGRGGSRRLAGFGLLLAIAIEGGMAALLGPVLLGLLIVAVIHALATETAPASSLASSRASSLATSLARLAAGTALGLAIAAGKLAAMAALMTHLPRDIYTPPGYPSLAQAAWVALRCVFVAPWPDMVDRLSSPHLFLHELDYGVGPMPLLLMLAAVATWRRPESNAVLGRRLLLWALLGVLLMVPLALNVHGERWTAFLKTLPVLRNSSVLLRWFAAYILPATIGGAVALDRLAARARNRGWILAGTGLAGTLAALVATVGGAAGLELGVGYDPMPLQSAWHRAVRQGVPPITALGRSRQADGSDDLLTSARQDAFLGGVSQLNCYQPLFGYALEAFPHGTLHPGSIFSTINGKLNIANPACTVFPTTNACRPGDSFPATRLADATAFAEYRRFAWRKPPAAELADWLGITAFCASALYLIWALCLIRPRERRA